jgi:flagellar basal-body rod protein FlgF
VKKEISDGTVSEGRNAPNAADGAQAAVAWNLLLKNSNERPPEAGGWRVDVVNSGLYTAFSGMQAQLDALEVLANNLANMNTAGFKEEKTFFTFLNQSLDSSPGLEELTRTVNRSVLAHGTMNPAVGSLNATHRNLDVAIEGAGFLAVQTPGGTRYTRNGNLQVNAQSVLVTSEGFPVLDAENSRPITLGPGTKFINEDGLVSLDDAAVARLKVVAFDDLSMLEREGHSLFASRSGAETEKQSDAKIRSGYLEQSNVNPIECVTQMVGILRHFEAIQKSIHLLMNDINSKAIDKLGR